MGRMLLNLALPLVVEHVLLALREKPSERSDPSAVSLTMALRRMEKASQHAAYGLAFVIAAACAAVILLAVIFFMSYILLVRAGLTDIQAIGVLAGGLFILGGGCLYGAYRKIMQARMICAGQDPALNEPARKDAFDAFKEDRKPTPLHAPSASADLNIVHAFMKGYGARQRAMR